VLFIKTPSNIYEGQILSVSAAAVKILTLGNISLRTRNFEWKILT
jgi:hypothetical protein